MQHLGRVAPSLVLHSTRLLVYTLLSGSGRWRWLPDRVRTCRTTPAAARFRYSRRPMTRDDPAHSSTARLDAAGAARASSLGSLLSVVHPNRTEIGLPSLSSSPDLICRTPEHPLRPAGAKKPHLKKSSRTAPPHLLTLLPNLQKQPDDDRRLTAAARLSPGADTGGRTGYVRRPRSARADR